MVGIWLFDVILNVNAVYVINCRSLVWERCFRIKAFALKKAALVARVRQENEALKFFRIGARSW